MIRLFIGCKSVLLYSMLSVIKSGSGHQIRLNFFFVLPVSSIERRNFGFLMRPSVLLSCFPADSLKMISYEETPSTYEERFSVDWLTSDLSWPLSDVFKGPLR